MEKIRIPVMFWQHVETYCLNMAISLFCPQLWAISPLRPFVRFALPYILLPSGKIFPKQKLIMIFSQLLSLGY
jgi:hypothetical protein